MHRSWGKIVIGGLIAIVVLGGAVWASSWLWSHPKDLRPTLVEVPPLAPVARNSVIVTPATIALSAIRDAMETAAPRNLVGKRDNPLPQLLSNAEMNWTVTRGRLAVTGRPDGLAVSTNLTGTFQATGQIAGDAGNLAGALGGLLGGRLGGVQNLQERNLISAPTSGGSSWCVASALLPAWRMEPSLSSRSRSRMRPDHPRRQVMSRTTSSRCSIAP